MALIRSAKPADAKRCEEISRIPELKDAEGNFIPDNYFRNCALENDDGLFMVAETQDSKDNEIIGYILGDRLKGNIAHLGLLAVSQESRNKGIGKELLEAFRDKCIELDLFYMFLYAPQENKNTLEFYKRCGLTEGKGHINFGMPLR